ncbi:MAG: carboxymuconolactone decarboxylase family protein [Alphaproteobacteria bacterium]|jgi:4-carboxymuconolactone decarboxylase|nr:carboxymuconolactone decarboxylase family protein [Alphaproteobacteria bacterium]
MTTREALRLSGAAIREQLGFPANSPETELAPGLDRLAEELVWGSIWARPGLALEDRMLAVLATLTSVQRLPQLRRYIGAALHIGTPPRTIQEVFIHCGIYSGFPTVLNALALANEVFAEKGIVVPDTEMPDLDAEALMALGRETMHALHGDRAERGYAAPGNATTASLYPTAIAYGYGEIWGRPDLDHRQRMVCTVAAFTAIHHLVQLAKFARSALNIGLNRQEIVEVIMQTAPYAGFPRALNALSAFHDALE